MPVDLIRSGLAAFSGVERRFQILGEKNGIMVIDDYGHHPTEVRATLGGRTSDLVTEVGCRVSTSSIFQNKRFA